MDQRTEEMKRLKKAYKRLLWKRTGIWRVLEAFSLLAAAAFGATALVPGMAQMLSNWIPELDFLLQQQRVVAAALDCLVLFFLFCLAADLAGRKVDRSQAYLDYRTIKNTLKAEKQENK